MPVKTIITSSELYEAMNRLGLRSADTRRVDRAMALPDSEYIQKDFANAFRSNLFDLGLGAYHPECWDCDDWALAAKFMANVCHARTNPGSKVGIAFGIFHYVIEATQQGHAINFWLSKDNGELKLHFWEPQQQTEVFLTQSEMTAAWYYV